MSNESKHCRSETNSDFRVISVSSAHAGKWLVVRESDMRLITEFVDVREALRWVATWGDTIGQKKRGRELSPRILPALVRSHHDRRAGC